MGRLAKREDLNLRIDFLSQSQPRLPYRKFLFGRAAQLLRVLL